VRSARTHTLASNHAHGFSDQNLELFGAAGKAKSATNAGLAYLDTQYPSKLADFTNHVTANGKPPLKRVIECGRVIVPWPTGASLVGILTASLRVPYDWITAP
jgi:hypothetical protein